jgi:hypothetical protein
MTYTMHSRTIKMTLYILVDCVFFNSSLREGKLSSEIAVVMKRLCY